MHWHRGPRSVRHCLGLAALNKLLSSLLEWLDTHLGREWPPVLEIWLLSCGHCGGVYPCQNAFALDCERGGREVKRNKRWQDGGEEVSHGGRQKLLYKRARA